MKAYFSIDATIAHAFDAIFIVSRYIFHIIILPSDSYIKL